MAERSVISIGAFDGVHRGHAEIVRRARNLADPRGAQVVVMAFAAHPATVLRPESAPPRLLDTQRKADLLRRCGADAVDLVEPTPELLGQSAEGFIETVVQRLAPVAVVEGPDFRFGKGRAGDLALLRRLGTRWGFDVVEVEPVTATLTDLTEPRISSTLVRWLLGRGRVADAAIALGRPFELNGAVIEGERRGRTIGVPTVNLGPPDDPNQLCPAPGVYGGTVQLLPAGGDGGGGAASAEAGATGGEAYPAAISVGVKPTFGGRRLTIEAHLLGYHGPELYGRRVRMSFARWVRDQYAFPAIDALRAQLARDIAQVRTWADSGSLVPAERFGGHAEAGRNTGAAARS